MVERTYIIKQGGKEVMSITLELDSSYANCSDF
jgi:hypothetical protein